LQIWRRGDRFCNKNLASAVLVADLVRWRPFLQQESGVRVLVADLVRWRPMS
jgi:hypothetical protein